MESALTRPDAADSTEMLKACRGKINSGIRKAYVACYKSETPSIEPRGVVQGRMETETEAPPTPQATPW